MFTLFVIPGLVETAENIFPGHGVELAHAFCVVADSSIVCGIALGVFLTLAVQSLFWRILHSDWYRRRKDG